jgi:hypothetical protein
LLNRERRAQSRDQPPLRRCESLLFALCSQLCRPAHCQSSRSSSATSSAGVQSAPE